MSGRKQDGILFCTCEPAAAKLLIAKVLRVLVMTCADWEKAAATVTDNLICRCQTATGAVTQVVGRERLH